MTAVTPGFLFRLANDGLAALKDGLLVLERELGVFLAEKIGVFFANRLAGVVEPEVLGHGAADHQEPAVAILKINPVRDALEQRAQQVALVGQSDLGLPLLGDIPKDALYASAPAGLVANRGLDDMHPRFLHLRRNVFLHRVQRLAALHDADVVLPVLVRKVSREKIKVGFPDDLPARLAQFFAEPFVGKREPPGSVLAENILRQVFHQRVKQNLGAAQLQLGSLLFHDILHGALVIKYPAGLVPYRAGCLRDPDPGVVPAENLRLELLDAPLLLNEFQEQISLLRLDVQLPLNVPDGLDQLRRGVVPVKLRQPVVGVNVPALLRGAKNAHHDIVKKNRVSGKVGGWRFVARVSHAIGIRLASQG